MKKTLKESPKVLGLDVSTRTIGWALFDIQSRELLELTHISPVPKPKEENKYYVARSNCLINSNKQDANVKMTFCGSTGDLLSVEKIK